MVDVDMSSTPPKVIGREACLLAKGPSRLSKDPTCKRRPNILWKEESKEIRDSMKVENGGLHCRRYNGCCMKQRIRIPKATLTSPILGIRHTCQTFSYRASLMKDKVKVKVPNITPRL
jgi:hypothetical protein